VDLQHEAFDAVRQAYLEYLDERYSKDPKDRQHREARFDNGDPYSDDQAKIKAAQDAYLEAIHENSGEVNATNEARDALFAQYYREEIKKRTVDPKLYAHNERYRDVADRDVEKLVAERLEQRQGPMDAQQAQEIEQSRQEGQQPNAEQEQKADWRRYLNDKSYQREVNDSYTKRQERQPQNDRER
jgi:hypothetical protein